MTDHSAIIAYRFGYGLPLPRGAAVDVAAMLAALQGPDVAVKRWPGVTLADAMPLHQAGAVARAQAKQGDAAKQAYKDAMRAVASQADFGAKVTMARAVGAVDGFRERLVAFWADHFTTVGRFRQDQALPAALVEDGIRPHVAGRFADLLKAAVLQPAMLIYLDQVLSYGPGSRLGQKRKRGLNENLAREVMELHTLGVGGGYTQDDVRQMAELLTGLDFAPGVGQVFDPERAEPGGEVVLGRLYEGDGMAPVLAALEDLALRPETARHLARKLAVHFVADAPDPDLIAAIAAAYLASGGDLLASYSAMLHHPAALALPLAKARQPYDFIIASLRALGLPPDEVVGLGRGQYKKMIQFPLHGMGQPWQKPGGPDGWAEEAGVWITPQGLAARISWAMEMPERLINTLPDPRDLVTRAVGPLASDRLIWAAARAESIREGVGVVLASPEFNRR